MTNVIPFRRKPTPSTSKFSYYSDDLIAVEEIIEDLAYPSSVMLLTGVLLNVLHRKNGDDIAASLDDVREFVRGLRLEIRQQEKMADHPSTSDT